MISVMFSPPDAAAAVAVEPAAVDVAVVVVELLEDPHPASMDIAITPAIVPATNLLFMVTLLFHIPIGLTIPFPRFT